MKIGTKLTLRYLFLSAIFGGFVFFILEETLFPQDGYDMLHILNVKLFAIWFFSILILYIIAYFMAKSALKPVSKIIKEVEDITAMNLSKRVEIENSNDELGELALTFNNTLDRLERSFESQKLFISQVSHELRTPMAALIAELELALYRDRSSLEYKEVIESALEDARKMDRLSKGLLDLAKANRQRAEISFTPVRLDEVLIDASTIISKANSEYKIDMKFNSESDDDDSITIEGNEYLLRTSFVNLIENNCKFSPEMSSMIEISFNNRDIEVSFSDNGIGISPEELEHIFTPFYRGVNGAYSSGNGIGLALVKKIVELHNGVVEVNSAINNGTTFKLLFHR